MLKKLSVFNSFLRNRKLQILVIIVAALITFSNIFSNRFVGDDNAFIVKWSIPKNVSNVSKILTTDSMPAGYEGSYRPLKTLMLLVLYKLFGLNIFGYHIWSVFVHLSTVILIYFITSEISKNLKENKKMSNLILFLPFLTTLLFALHPVHADAITFMAASVDSFGITLFLISLFFYLKSKAKKYGENIFYLVSLIFAGLSFFYYEMAVTLPSIIILSDLCFDKKMFIKTKISKLLKVYLPYFILLGIFFFIRIDILKITVRGSGYLGNSFYLTMLTMAKVFSKYFLLMFFPFKLSINPVVSPGIYSLSTQIFSLPAIYSQSIFDPDILFSLALILILIFLGFKFYKKLSILSFSIGFFMITLLPVSQIFPSGAIMQERHAYLASFSVCLILAFLAIKFLRLKGIFIVLAIGLFFGARTYLRNKDWQNGFRIWSSAVKNEPNDILANFNLSEELYNLKQIDRADKYYQKALTLQEQNISLEVNAANRFFEKGKIKEGENYFNEILSAFPDYLSAQPVLEKILALNIDNPDLSVKKAGLIWTGYKQDREILFFYPADWSVKKTGQVIVIDDSNQLIHIELGINKFEGGEDQYVKNEPGYGKLIKQGKALVPNAEKAMINFWLDQGVEKLQLFLFKNKKAATVLMYPANSKLQEEFKLLLTSITL